jgi:predicted Rdx family selenoprotein
LKDGWLEGCGTAPKIEHLSWLSNEIGSTFPDDLEYPSVAPTEDGNIVFEWIRPHARIELEVNFSEKQLEIYATNLKTSDFVEEVMSLQNWEEAYQKIEKLLLL